MRRRHSERRQRAYRSIAAPKQLSQPGETELARSGPWHERGGGWPQRPFQCRTQRVGNGVHRAAPGRFPVFCVALRGRDISARVRQAITCQGGHDAFIDGELGAMP